jgi:sec-independent protein translocase protein TatB
VGRASGGARQFRSGLDTMIRECELADMEKQWAAENERIMREHPPTPALPAPQPEHFAPADADPVDADPVMVEQPALFSEPPEDPAPKPKRTRKPKAAAPDEPQS